MSLDIAVLLWIVLQKLIPGVIAIKIVISVTLSSIKKLTWQGALTKSAGSRQVVVRGSSISAHYYFS